MMRLGILSNVNLDLLKRQLEKEHEVYIPDGFGQWIQETMIPNNKLIAFNPNAIFLLLDGNALIEGITDPSEAETELRAAISHCERLAKNYTTVQIFISNIDIKPKSILSGDSIRPEHAFLAIWEKQLNELIQKIPNLHLFELRLLIENIGRDNFYSDKMWYLGSMPYSMKAVKLLAQSICDKLQNHSKTRKKVLVLDLDNTLWGGVLGEDGENGIQLSRSNIGAAYRDAQIWIKELARTGILLAIASKNEKDDVLHVLEHHPMMVLKPDDFVAIYVNWNSKSQNIADMAQNLNLGLDSFVFLDDNPVEREAVRLALPNVTIVDFPHDITKLPQTIQNIANDYFYISRLTSEDLAKTEQYQQETKRKAMMDTAASIEEYLRSLQIDITLQEMQEEQLERVSQLTQKTNQFNLTTKRFTPEQIIEYRNTPGNHIYVANVSDKFGDSGLVLILMVSQNKNIGHIDNLLMSCRVMGRHIEDAVVDAVERHLYSIGVTKITADYLPTPKNTPVKMLMERLDYTVSDVDDEIKHYTRNLKAEATQRVLLFNVNEKLYDSIKIE